MEIGKDDLGVIGIVFAWIVAIASMGAKTRSLIGRVESLENDMKHIKETIEENKKELDHVSRSMSELMSEHKSSVKIIDLHFAQITKEITRINSDFKNYQDINNDTLKALAGMYQQQTDGIKDLTIAIDLIKNKN